MSCGNCLFVAYLLSSVRLFCDPMDCSSPGSSVHGISQARILEWLAIPFSRGSSWPRGQTCIFYIAGRFFSTDLAGKPSWGREISKNRIWNCGVLFPLQCKLIKMKSLNFSILVKLAVFLSFFFFFKLAVFQIFCSYMQLVATILDTVLTEYFHHCRNYRFRKTDIWGVTSYGCLKYRKEPIDPERWFKEIDTLTHHTWRTTAQFK